MAKEPKVYKGSHDVGKMRQGCETFVRLIKGLDNASIITHIKKFAYADHGVPQKILNRLALGEAVNSVMRKYEGAGAGAGEKKTAKKAAPLAKKAVKKPAPTAKKTTKK